MLKTYVKNRKNPTLDSHVAVFTYIYIIHSSYGTGLYDSYI